MKHAMGIRAAVVTMAVAALTAKADAQTTPVSAQDAAARRQLIEEAQRASQAGNHEQAINLAERASQIEMTPSLRLFLAQEARASRRFVVALGHADLCLREVGALAALNNRERIVQGCTSVQVEARAAIGRVVVRVPASAPPDTTVTVNGNALNRATWGVPTPVDPGAIRVAANGSGQEEFALELNVASGQEQVIDVVFRRRSEPASGTTGAGRVPLQPSGGERPRADVGPRRAEPEGAEEAPRSAALDAPRPSNAGPIALMSVGGALAIGAAASAAMYLSVSERFHIGCPMQFDGTRLCDPALRSSEGDFALTSGLGWGLGAAAVATVSAGAIWMVMNNGSSGRAEQRALWIAPDVVARSHAGIVLGGAL